MERVILAPMRPLKRLRCTASTMGASSTHSCLVADTFLRPRPRTMPVIHARTASATRRVGSGSLPVPCQSFTPEQPVQGVKWGAARFQRPAASPAIAAAGTAATGRGEGKGGA